MTPDIFSEHAQAVLLQVITVLTLLEAALTKLAAMTENKVDDKILTVVRWILAILPRISFGVKK